MLTNTGANATARSWQTGAMALVFAVALSGCANSKLTTGSIGRDSGKPIAQMSSQELDAAAGTLPPAP